MRFFTTLRIGLSLMVLFGLNQIAFGEVTNSRMNGSDDIPTFTKDVSKASAGNLFLGVQGLNSSDATLGYSALTTVTCPSGTESLSQDFEGAGSWSYTVNNASQALPCDSPPDFIGEGSSVGTGGDAITANGGTQFFATRDINGDCAGTNGVDLEFATFTATAGNEGSYAISFDYNTFGWNSGDIISYFVTVNGGLVDFDILVNGSPTGGWLTETITLGTNLTAGDELDFTITIEQDGDDGWAGIDNVVLCFTAPLPVDLASFDVKATDQAALLNWETASESNNSHFVVERSTDDGSTFETIAHVTGKGDSESFVGYEFIDQAPSSGFNYYRLQQYDFDGTKTTFGPIAVRFSGEVADSEVRLWPVPASDVVNVGFPNVNNSWTVQVVSLNGQLLLQQVIGEGTANTALDVQQLPAGSYILRLIGGDQIMSKRFVKS